MTTFCCLSSWESAETSSSSEVLLQKKKLPSVSTQVLLIEDFCLALLSFSPILDLQEPFLTPNIPN